MQDHPVSQYPTGFEQLLADTEQSGFSMASEPQTGVFLSTLAATKPGGQLLEIGTGTGLSAAWLLKGMDDKAQLLTVDTDAAAQQVALKHLGDDQRFTAICEDGGKWLEDNQNRRFDLIFADAWPGKFSHLEQALNLLEKGGIYIIDDLLPQPNWPEGHAPKVPELISSLQQRENVATVTMAWATGLMVVVKR